MDLEIIISRTWLENYRVILVVHGAMKISVIQSSLQVVVLPLKRTFPLFDYHDHA